MSGPVLPELHGLTNYFDLPSALHVRWAHAVNSEALLKKALDGGEIDMLEADLCYDEASQQVFMAHPPETTSDLPFVRFLDAVIGELQAGRRVGMKLDFKMPEAVAPVLEAIEKRADELHSVPLWLNCDAVQGPMGAKPRFELEPFIRQCVSGTERWRSVADKPLVLSIGWTSAGDRDDLFGQSFAPEHMQACLEAIVKHSSADLQFTFAARARLMMSESGLRQVARLLDQEPSVTLTLWDHTGVNFEDHLVPFLAKRVPVPLKARMFVDVAHRE